MGATSLSCARAYAYLRDLILLRPSMLFLCAVVLRCVHALLVSTYFNPDEFWQSLEVAHNMVFGTGFLTWEWQPHARIRSAAHPAIFAALYWLLQKLSIDSALMVVRRCVLPAAGSNKPCAHFFLCTDSRPAHYSSSFRCI